MRLPVLLLAPALAIGLSGCLKPPTFDGKWVGEFGEHQAHFTFSDEKTLTIYVEAHGAKVEATGEFKVTKKEVHLSVKDVKVTGPDPKTVEKLLPGLKSRFKVPYKATFQFNTPDELALTANGKTQHLIRFKETEEKKKDK